MQFNFNGRTLLANIATEGDLYSVRNTNITIAFKKPPNNQQEAEDFVANFLPELVSGQDVQILVVSVGFFGNKRNYLIHIDGMRFRYVAEQLFSHGLMSPSDRSSIETLVRKLEKINENRLKLVDFASVAQRDIMTSLVAPYLEDFFSIGNPVASLKLLQEVRGDYIHDLKVDAYFRVLTFGLRQNAAIAAITKTYNTKAKLHELFGSLCSFSLIYNGRSSVEGAFLQAGENVIPNITVQREVINKILCSEFKEAYGFTDGLYDFVFYLVFNGYYSSKLSNIDMENPVLSIHKLLESINNPANYSSVYMFELEAMRLPDHIQLALNKSGCDAGKINFKKFLTDKQFNVLGLDKKVISTAWFFKHDQVCGPRTQTSESNQGWLDVTYRNTTEDRSGPGYGF